MNEPDLVGTTLGHFEITAKLGAGGMGVVYAALDTRLKREVALKFLPAALAGDSGISSRFEREAEAVAALNHPNIVTIHAVEGVDDQRFIVMERVEGKSLDKLIPEDGMAPDRFLGIAIALSNALAAAHERGIVHRDLKPSNIMQTTGGLIKVLDFGLAKLLLPSGADDQTLAAGDLTQEGAIAGTPAYMSPEQVKGAEIDHRTDIFSLGIVFYEMVTGVRPFAGGSAAEVASSILRDRPASTNHLRASMPRSLSRIIDHCLEKDPDLRFQTAKELHHQLLSLKKEFESDEVLKSAEDSRAHRQAAAPDTGLGGRSPRRVLAWAGAAILALVVGAGVYSAMTDKGAVERPAARVEPRAAPDTERPSVALLHFRNLTGDARLKWLEAGLPEMLSTSLSQATGLEILATDRVDEILREIGAKGEPTAEWDREFATRAEVANILSGNFARLGETFRVAIKLEDVATGATLLSDQVEGVGESSLFSLVDQISERVLRRLEVVDSVASGASEEIMEVTTASLEAYRYYSEAIRLRRETKREEALSLLEKAVEIDPGFSMALSMISTGYLNMGDDERARSFARRAFETSARAPARERYYIQGMYLGLEWTTYGEAISALQRAVDSYPDHDDARRNLAYYLGQLERYEQAIPHYQKLVAEAPLFGGNYYLLTESYDALDRFDDGQRVTLEYLRRSSGNWYGHLFQGWHLMRWGRAEEALRSFAAADSRRPGTNEVLESQWAANIQLERWEEAEKAAVAMAGSNDDSYYRWLGNVYLGRSELYRGRAEPALEAIREAARGFSKPGAQPGMAHVWAADLLVQTGDAQAALEEATLAKSLGEGQWPQLNGEFLAGLALEHLGRSAEADRLAGELQRRVDLLPNNPERRQALHLSGLLDRSRGDLEGAVDKLTRAVALLPPRGFSGRHRIPDHAPLWYSLAETLEEAGRDSEAASWFERVVENRVESRNFPIRWARSLYHLGSIHEELGEDETARGYFRRFSELWGGGDIDRRELAHAGDSL